MTNSTVLLPGQQWLKLLDTLEDPMIFYSLCFLTYRLSSTRRFTLEQWKYMLEKTHPCYETLRVEAMALQLQMDGIIERGRQIPPSYKITTTYRKALLYLLADSPDPKLPYLRGLLDHL